MGFYTGKNVLVTGHQAFLTENAINNIIGDTLQHCSDWSLGKAAAKEI